MPKIIAHLRETLLSEAGRILTEDGYSRLTIRGVAEACHIGTGTVYRYFPSKEMLVASVILADWQEVLRQMETLSDAPDFFSALGALVRLLDDFRARYSHVFDESRDSVTAPAFSDRHVFLRGQIAEILGRLCARYGRSQDPDALRCVAQLILSGCSEGWDTEALFPLFSTMLPPVGDT